MDVYVLLISTYIDEPFQIEGVFESVEAMNQYVKKKGYTDFEYRIKAFPLITEEE